VIAFRAALEQIWRFEIIKKRKGEEKITTRSTTNVNTATLEIKDNQGKELEEEAAAQGSSALLWADSKCLLMSSHDRHTFVLRQ
jgi:hypothetical protein